MLLRQEAIGLEVALLWLWEREAAFWHGAAGNVYYWLQWTKGALCNVQAWLVRSALRLQKEALLFTDERSKLEGELLNGIDVVKCNSWEVRTMPSADASSGFAHCHCFTVSVAANAHTSNAFSLPIT